MGSQLPSFTVIEELILPSQNKHLCILEQYASRANKAGWFWKVHTDMPAFKKVNTYCVEDQDKVYIRPHGEKLKSLSDRCYRLPHHIMGAIANLVIPKGAEVFFNPQILFASRLGKLRASKAICHSIVRVSDKEPVLFGSSFWDRTFMYLNSEMLQAKKIVVKPKDGFDPYPDACKGGIHFYLDLDMALAQNS